MTDANKLRDALEADAHRRAEAVRTAPPVETVHSASWELRFRLVNTLPREARPVFDTLRAALEPYGYLLSPLHPPHDLSHPRMLTELARAAPDDPWRAAPLVFELAPGAARLRVYVRQFGGRSAPDFAERTIDLSPGPATLEAILCDYVVCMLEAPLAAAA